VAAHPFFVREELLMFGNTSVKQTLASLILRLALAAVFIYHGLDKIIGHENNWGAEWAAHLRAEQGKVPRGVKDRLHTVTTRPRENQTAAEKEQVKEKVDWVEAELARAYTESTRDTPEPLQWHAAQLAVAWGELLGGLALLVGFMSRLAAAGLIIIQVGAILTVTWTQGFDIRQGGYEYNVVLIGACLAVLCLGSGPFSLSGLLRSRRRKAAPQPAQPQQPVSV
jgi:uncharacterized membrane protein YphA (DoxX/SURF4 family)